MKMVKLVMVLSILGLLGQAAAQAADGAAIFGAKCASCHGKDGKGNAAMAKMFKVEPAALDLTASKNSDEEIAKIIADGKNKMPGYAKQLKADELKAVTEYSIGLAPKKSEASIEEKQEVEAEAEAEKPAAIAVTEEAKSQYAKSCASCHGKDGKGNASMAKMFKVDPSALDMVDAGTLGKSDAELNKITANGLNKMPAYKGKISDKLIAEITAYLRSLKQ